MSGGVDSSVSAALLKYGGFSARGGPAVGRDVIGVFMKCWNENDELTLGQCTAVDDEYNARRVAGHLGIPFYSFNFIDEYKTRVVDYFVREYAAGRTPNPDVMCNKEIKFGIFFEKVMGEMGADFMATGHYARISTNSKSNTNKRLDEPQVSRFVNSQRSRYSLMKASDGNKDQSYFLYRVSSEKLARTIFPIGEYEKPQVREMAREFGLPNSERPDSQGICFIGEIKVRDFLKHYIPDSPGPIINHKGETIGTHDGLHLYTIGQRKGIGIGGGLAYYVTAKDYKTNTLLVAFEYDDKLKEGECMVEDLHWIGDAPKFPLHVNGKLRYRQPDQGMTLYKEGDKARAVFDSPQRAVTPGQSAVFYQGEECLGGGTICGKV
ncbi:MAG: tRNA 2-thiouridine(34) synthase MnmA [Candidatus Spechtbacteria bacterium]|nr:tRNA 2-thiouridine(34) synthase MnmA [Candidatus Spechtbacteria bacterium]